MAAKKQPKSRSGKTKPFAISLLTLCVSASITPAIAQHMNEKSAPCQNLAPDEFQPGCMYSAFQKADRDLNKLYERTLLHLGTTDQRNLRAAQRLWVQFRDADCSAEYHLYGGGSGGPMAKSACLEAVTRQRMADLSAIYGWRIAK
jgi:uncharacterized protein YecT (DUF1311 family)